MNVVSKKEITLTEKEVREIICDHLRDKEYSVIEDNVKFVIDNTDDEYPFLKECVVEADIHYL